MILPPKPPDVAHFDTGRTSRIILPNGVCPSWFSGGAEVLFVPLYWKDELQVSELRKLEALLIYSADRETAGEDWLVRPDDLLVVSDEEMVPENRRAALFVFRSKLSYVKQQWKLNCPPMVKGLCDSQKRLYAVEHPLGVSIWSPSAFNEHFGQ